MIPTPTPTRGLFAEVLDPSSRADPYPLYARLRESPVALQPDGVYVVSTYAEIVALLHDPRISSDERKGVWPAAGQIGTEDGQVEPPFLRLDPPEHDRLRRLVVNQLTPPRIAGMRGRIVELVDSLLSARAQDGWLDVVSDLAYPLPVTVICELLGVPREDEPRFHVWAQALARTIDPLQDLTREERRRAGRARVEMREYMARLVATRRARPRDDVVSSLAAGRDPAGHMSDDELTTTLGLLLIAGHETTVNLIANGTLALLRHPDALDRLRRDPDLAATAVEEVLRYDPPVQFRTRTTLTEVAVAGVTIPRGSPLVLLLAAGSRDEAHVPDPDRFDPTRTDNEHLGFGGGIHYCVGAPLARIEAQVALSEVARRLAGPRLAADPPPYRRNAALRGPEHLVVTFDHMEG